MLAVLVCIKRPNSNESAATLEMCIARDAAVHSRRAN